MRYWLSRSVVALLLLIAGCGGVEPAGEIAASDSGVMEELPAATFGPNDWPWWRGPSGDGLAPGGAAPTSWSETANVLWKVPVPGRGHASPTVVGERIFLATAGEAEEKQSVICFERASGNRLWQTTVHEGGFFRSGMHAESTHASCTVACDGQRLFAVFPNRAAIWLTALDLEGTQLWQRNLGSFASRFGYGASPVVFGSYVIVAADHDGGGFLAAVHRKSGEILWRKRRPGADSYATPAVFHVAGKDQLLISGGRRLSSYNPLTSEELWTCSGTAELTVGTVVRDGDLLFAGGGYPQHETLCVRAATGEAVWRNDTHMYTSSMLVHEGYLYGITDNGIAHCWQADTGDQKWQARIEGNVRSSPVLAGGNLYISSLNGKTTVFRANPERFQRIAVNQTGDEIFATPSICGGRIYLRAADHSSGARRENLYCIGSK
jgi:hypothetical protein